MKTLDTGRPYGAALLVCVILTGIVTSAKVRAQDVLAVLAADGTEIARLDFAPHQEICLTWAHSVTGGKVADCFENQQGQMVLMRSFLHDFAAGLGDIPGRGKINAAAGGGYWITGINEAIPANTLSLRVGSIAVGHSLDNGAHRIALSALAPRARVALQLQPDPR